MASSEPSVGTPQSIRSNSLKTRVALFTLVVFLVSLWSLSFYVGHLLHQDMQQVLGAQQLSTATLLARELDQKLATHLLVATIFLSLLAGSFSWWMLRRQLEPLHAAVRALARLSGTSQPWQPLPI